MRTRRLDFMDVAQHLMDHPGLYTVYNAYRDMYELTNEQMYEEISTSRLVYHLPTRNRTALERYGKRDPRERDEAVRRRCAWNRVFKDALEYLQRDCVHIVQVERVKWGEFQFRREVPRVKPDPWALTQDAHQYLVSTLDESSEVD